MKDIEKALKTDFGEGLEKIHFSDKRRLYKLYSEPKRSYVPKRTAAIAVALAAILMAAGITAGAVQRSDYWMALRNIIAEKTADENISEEKLNDMADRLENYGVDPSSLDNYGQLYKVNKYDETLGAFDSAADLIAVGSKDGNSSGYVYRTDLAYFKTWLLLPEEHDALLEDEVYHRMKTADKNSIHIRNWIYVFDENGTAYLGKMEGQDYQFYTNEDLEDPEIDKLFAKEGYGSVFDYIQYADDRMNYKIEMGTAKPLEKVYRTYEVQTENLERYSSLMITDEADWDSPKRYGNVFGNTIVLSDDATAESSNPDIAEVDDITCSGYETDEPYTVLYFTVHKLGTTVFTVKDGDKEYKYEMTFYSTPRLQTGCFYSKCKKIE